MNDTAETTTTEITTTTTPDYQAIATIAAAGVALGGVLIGAQVLYKRYVKKVPPLATGE